MKHFYSTDTGERIATDSPADWMGATDVTPPAYDPATAGCFWRGAAWEIVVATPTPQPTYQELRAAAYPPLLNLIDGLVKDDAVQIQAYKDACFAVKALYPKV